MLSHCLVHIVFALLLLFVAPGVQAQTSAWHTISNVVFEADDFNDGDSFHATKDGKEYIFRLYYVDAPETVKTYSDRIHEQAIYWGITDRQVMEIGKEASAFARDFLRQPFTIKTCWHKALGRSTLPRHYAIVLSGDGRRDLAEELVRNGLGQIYGEHRKLPDGLNRRQWFARLLRAEVEARRYRRGAWKLVPANAPLNNDRGARQTSEGAVTVLMYDAPAYAIDGSGRQVGLLKSNSVIWLEEEFPDGWMRCRYEPEDNSVIIEFRARKKDLGLPEGPVLQKARSDAKKDAR